MVLKLELKYACNSWQDYCCYFGMDSLWLDLNSKAQQNLNYKSLNGVYIQNFKMILLKFCTYVQKLQCSSTPVMNTLCIVFDDSLW